MYKKDLAISSNDLLIHGLVVVVQMLTRWSHIHVSFVSFYL